MLQRGDYAREICYFVVIHASSFPCNLLGQYPFFFFSAFFFGVAQAFKRRFCSGICYFSVFLHPIILRLWGSNMLQRGDYAREICSFVVIHASPFPLQPVRAVSIFIFFSAFFFGIAQALYIYIYI